MTANSLQQFEQQKMLQQINADESANEAEKMTNLNNMMRRLIEVTVKAMAQSITEIRRKNGWQSKSRDYSRNR
jgi:hypothetical protein